MDELTLILKVAAFCAGLITIGRLLSAISNLVAKIKAFDPEKWAEVCGKLDRIDPDRWAEICAKFDRIDPDHILELRFQMKQVWEARARNARIELLATGAGQENSPVAANPDLLERYRAIGGELCEFYRNIGRYKPEWELLLEAQARWGPWIEDNICKPLLFRNDACLLAAVQAMRKFYAETGGEAAAECDTPAPAAPESDNAR